MWKELCRASTGETYEHADTVLLLDVSEDERSHDEIEEDIRLRYSTNWCNHSHACCGCWKTSVVKVAIDHWTAIVHLMHIQNV